MEIPKGRTLGRRRSKDQDLKAGHDWHLPRPQRRPRGMEVGSEIRRVRERGRESESPKGPVNS